MKILQRKNGSRIPTEGSDLFDGISRKSKSRRGRNNANLSGASIDNNDLDDVFDLREEDFASMGYIDSMK